MNLATPYLGLRLANPNVVGASPFCDNAAVARQLQDAGASALVMHSLFEEQIEAEQHALARHVEFSAESSAEATSYFPDYAEYQLSPDNYARQLGRLKADLTIPVIASLNDPHPGGWLEFARRLEDPGADGIELPRPTAGPSVPGMGMNLTYETKCSETVTITVAKDKAGVARHSARKKSGAKARP